MALYWGWGLSTVDARAVVNAERVTNSRVIPHNLLTTSQLFISIIRWPVSPQVFSEIAVVLLCCFS